MNNARRKVIASCIKRLEGATTEIEAIVSDLADVVSEEDDARDCMPENLQSSPRYEESEEASEALNDAISSLTEIQDQVQSAIEALENIN